MDTTQTPASSMTVEINNGGVVDVIKLDNWPVNPEFADEITALLMEFEAIVRDRPAKASESPVAGLEHPDGPCGPTGGALIALHCADQLRDYVNQNDIIVSTAQKSSNPALTFVFCTMLEEKIQTARIASALAAYRVLRQKSDGAQACERVLRMLDSTTPSGKLSRRPCFV